MYLVFSTESRYMYVREYGSVPVGAFAVLRKHLRRTFLDFLFSSLPSSFFFRWNRTISQVSPVITDPFQTSKSSNQNRTGRPSRSMQLLSNHIVYTYIHTDICHLPIPEPTNSTYFVLRTKLPYLGRYSYYQVNRVS